VAEARYEGGRKKFTAAIFPPVIGGRADELIVGKC
jgi:hypothetical protein